MELISLNFPLLLVSLFLLSYTNLVINLRNNSVLIHEFMIMNNSLKSILLADPIKNFATAGFFSNYDLQKFYVEKDSAFLFGASDHFWAHIVSNSENDTEQLLVRYQATTKFYYSLEDCLLPLISKYGETV